MQNFPCPFCGERDEQEFFFAGEAGKLRPDTMGAVAADEWADYLHAKRNEKGEVREIWIHRNCFETFLMVRDSQSMDVLDIQPLRKKAL